MELRDGDVVCVAQKVVSKAEGRVVRLDEVEPSAEARRLAGSDGDPRRLEVVLSRVRPGRPQPAAARDRRDPARLRLRIGRRRRLERARAEHRRPAPGGSRRLRGAAQARVSRRRTGRSLGVIVTDTFGRSWRLGITNVAIGASGIEVLRDLRGVYDPAGYELHSTVIAIADEIAAAAELVMGKTARIPVAVVRGVDVKRIRERGSELVMPAAHDLFR